MTDVKKDRESNPSYNIEDIGLERSVYRSLVKRLGYLLDEPRGTYELGEEGGSIRPYDKDEWELPDDSIACIIQGGVGPYTVRVNTTPNSPVRYTVDVTVPIKGVPVDLEVGITQRDIEIMQEKGQDVKEFIRDRLSTLFGKEQRVETQGVERIVLGLITAISGVTLLNVLSVPERTGRVFLPGTKTVVTIVGLGLILVISLSMLLFRRKFIINKRNRA